MKNILQKNAEATLKVRSAANNMDVLLIALDSITKSIIEISEEVWEETGDTHGYFACARELSTLQGFLEHEMESLEDLAEKLEEK